VIIVMNGELLVIIGNPRGFEGRYLVEIRG